MSSIGIITDSSVQFSIPAYAGKKSVIVLPHHLRWIQEGIETSSFPKTTDLPQFVTSVNHAKVEASQIDEIQKLLTASLPLFDDILVIVLSKEINPLYSIIETISQSVHGHANLHLIDSQNICLGLGFLVQYAGSLIEKGFPADEIEKKVRLSIPHIYSVFCTPNLSYLNASGFIDFGQSTIGEMMGLYPLFAMEDGKMNPLQKVKNQKAAIEYFIEFVDEFEELSQIGFIQPTNLISTESKLFHQHIEETFQDYSYSEHLISPFCSALFGPKGFGTVIMEKI